MQKALIILLVLSSFSFSLNNINEKLVGKWVGEFDEMEMTINFQSDNYIIFQTEEKTIGGKNFEMNGDRYEAKYQINNKVSPYHLDFVLKNLNTSEIEYTKCLLVFIDNNTIKLCIGEEDRPENFDPDLTSIFKRVNK